jgi:methionyl aminopeptidase
MSMKIIVKTPQQIQSLREGGKYHNELLLLIYHAAKPGVSLLDLEKIASDYLISHKLKSAFKGFHNYPANICLSVNDCIVHGIPDTTILKNGDLLKIDIGIVYQGMITDAAVCKIIWWYQHNKAGAELMRTTKEALDKSLELVKPGASLMEYGRRVGNFVNQKGCSIIKSLTGHGVGKGMHEDPRIPNYADPRLKGIKFRAGMVIALEPITAEISQDYTTHKNKRNLITQHGDLGCQREYTVLVTETGYEILAGITNL